MAAGRRPQASAHARHQQLVDEAKALIALWARQPVRLSNLAARLSCSVFHVCRTFRRVEGTTIHEYQQDLRLRLALEELPDCDSLTPIAFDLGFCSHSHFTAAFRRRFSLTPSAYAASIGRPPEPLSPRP